MQNLRLIRLRHGYSIRRFNVHLNATQGVNKTTRLTGNASNQLTHSPILGAIQFMFTLNQLSIATLGAALIAGAMGTIPAQAAVLVRPYGPTAAVVGIENLEIAGVTYDVDFRLATFNELYSSKGSPNPLPTFWNNQTSAQEAISKIQELMSSNDVFITGDDQRTLFSNALTIPYRVGDWFDLRGFRTYRGSLSWETTAYEGHATTEEFYAYFTIDNHSVAVPTPALLPGLVGLGMAALRKRRENQGQEAAETAQV
ncbi:PTPA-CTERM sorting domain-containing protein [Leptolyngbya sp. NK1-12]|uniref:PTPA-CTERM sorting domain-containing protein n=1 Tax=Leptolyngbya sp. NK1-12 TaxID=2547451 RepID=A0AA97AQD1_9CYAN|nr:PTPA-CTERM sorting domain-containing protein [Leptolyngbya sp. NK1-12]WNZ23313.1 PTPA-CTERM sorting domain-containing protein [Leptolyngbya sp. NK1-12]